MENPNQPQGAQSNPNPAPQNQMPPQGYGPQQPPYSQQQPYAPAPPQGGKSSTAAGLLGIFLGTFGVHDFYLGYKQLAFIHLGLGGGGFILTVIGGMLPLFMLSSGNIAGAIGSSFGLAPILIGLGTLCMSASGIWGFVEGIMCFTKNGKYGRDANGTPLV